MTYHAKVVSGGKVVIPAELRRELGITDGDSLVFDRAAGGGISIKTYRRVVEEGQREFRGIMGDYSVNQFLAERRADSGEDRRSSSTRRRCSPSFSTNLAPNRSSRSCAAAPCRR